MIVLSGSALVAAPAATAAIGQCGAVVTTGSWPLYKTTVTYTNCGRATVKMRAVSMYGSALACKTIAPQGVAQWTWNAPLRGPYTGMKAC